MISFVLVTPVLLGVAHAFDADHIVAVSALVSTSSSPRRALGTAVIWGIGHMLPILAVAAAGVLLGVALPQWALAVAERGAGVMLIALGLMVLFTMRRNRLHIHTHTHGGIQHTHFHRHERLALRHQHTHAAVLTGLVHGLAGSATPMVLVSLGAAHQPWEALLFVGVFGLAVAATMAAYAFCLGHLSAAAGRRSRQALPALRGVAAVACVAVGTMWVVTS